MSNKITNFYKKTNIINNVASEDSDDEMVENEANGNIKCFEEMLKRQSEVKTKAKIVLNKKSAFASQVWDHFGQMFVENKPVLKRYHICKICFEATPMHLKGFSLTTSTSNLINHLRSVHFIHVSLNALATIKTKLALEGNTKMLKSSQTEKFANTRLLVQMLSRDLRPFNTVEQPGFIDYMKIIKPSLKLPSASTLSRSALPDVYATYKGEVIKYIKNYCPEHIALVLDMWTDSFKKRGYINVRVLFGRHFETVCITLKTEYFPHPHDKFSVSRNINDTLKCFSLEKKNIVVVSDGGSNIVAAMKLNNMNRLGCSSHSLHRFIVHDVLQNKDFSVFSNTVIKLKHIYKFLNYNTERITKIQHVFEEQQLVSLLSEATDIFSVLEAETQFVAGDVNCNEDFDIDNNLMSHKSLGSLKNSNDTRWNTLCNMFKSFCKNQKVINIALVEIGKTELALNKMEKMLMEEFLKFLEIFEDATRYLQGRKYPTINTNIVFLEKIQDTIEKNEETVSFEESVKMYKFARERFSKRFEIKKIHLIAALLDPIQKNWGLLDKWIRKVSITPAMNLFDKLSDDYPDKGISRQFLILKELLIFFDKGHQEDYPTTSKKVKKQETNKIQSSIASFISSTSGVENKNPLEIEIKKYFDATVEEECDTFTWWKENEKKFPNISKLAAVVLSVPSTSAASEQAFSSAGALVTAKRSSLNPLTVNQILFIHDNYEIFNSKTSD